MWNTGNARLFHHETDDLGGRWHSAKYQICADRNRVGYLLRTLCNISVLESARPSGPAWTGPWKPSPDRRAVVVKPRKCNGAGSAKSRRLVCRVERSARSQRKTSRSAGDYDDRLMRG